MVLAEILTKYREEIIQEWIERLHEQVSTRYHERPYDELFLTVSTANDASFAVLVNNDFSKINEHIEWITRIRLEGGFSLAEVQNAYELYRVLLTPILIRELRGKRLFQAIQKMNTCLFYTITRFSDFFQSLHEKKIREHALNLERIVEERTKEHAESEAKYRVLVEDINDGYFVNQNGIIVFANQAFSEMHGYNVRDVINKPYTDFVADGSLDYVKKLYEGRIAQNDSQNLYFYFRRHKNGSTLPTENKVKVMFYQGEYAVAGICRDITERIEAERRVRESERLAHIGKLTTSLAHEIRNPLSSVKMNSQLMLKNVELDGNNKRRMEIVVSEISRLEKILDEMLDFTRQVKLRFSPASINAVVDSCLEILEVKIKEKGIVVRKHYSTKIPDIYMDREKMEQAIINILLNSLEALPEGGKIGITTRYAVKNGRTLSIEISDSGPGIDDQDFPYVFDPFFSSKKKGTGLGLSNVKKIIEAHGGNVRAVRKRQRGTHLYLTMPARGRVVG